MDPLGDDFLDWGAPLGHFGDRRVGYRKFSETVSYFGELSPITNKPHGRGIKIKKDGTLEARYFEDGLPAKGKYVFIFSDGSLTVGEKYTGTDGKTHIKGTHYDKNRPSEKF